MLDQVVAAFERQDYRTASQLLKELLKQSPNDPWVQFYLGRLQELSGKLDAAEAIYRKLLRKETHLKLVGQARQGIKRIEDHHRDRRQQAIAQAMATAESNDPGFLILEAVTGDARTIAIQNFARLMKVDAYTARLLLPSRGWRLYRTGVIGELQLYGQELCEAGIPAFWASLPQINKIHVFQVKYFQATGSDIVATCINQQEQLGALTFDRSEVSQCVAGMLPIFERVVDLDQRSQLVRKEQTQDYTQIYDLHLPGRQSILRLQDNRYEFDRGAALFPQLSAVSTVDRNTIRTNWNQLLEFLSQQLPQAEVSSNFTAFAETATDFAIPLNRLPAHIHLMRRTDSYWDPAFHLYSSMILLKQNSIQ